MSGEVGIIEAVGFAASLLSLINFGVQHFPKEKPVGSVIRVTVGLDVKGGLNNAGGDLPDVRLFNEAGDFIGMTADPGKVESGGFGDIAVRHSFDHNQQATYALFSANKDAICIAYASITWPSGDKYAWVGDWGRACGGSWYHSNVYISESGVTPDCFWIDANNDTPQTGFQIHWPEFTNSTDNPFPETPEAKQCEIDYLCGGGPPFIMHNYPDKDPRSIISWVPNKARSLSNGGIPATRTSYGPPKHPLSAGFQPTQRSPQPGQITTKSLIGMSLVVSDKEQHSAEDLCESATSFGPDFLNTRSGAFCRMSDKTIWPVCGTALMTDNCFNNEINQLIVNGVTTRDSPYGNVVDWTSGFNSTV